jgi:glycosyltransferase involved in cell wall biosynthesis
VAQFLLASASLPVCVEACTRSCFPLTTYEYLAAGKPVIATGVPELAEMEPDVVLVDGAASFVEADQKAVGRNAEADRLRRGQLAARNSWERKTDQPLKLVRRELDTRKPAA